MSFRQALGFAHGAGYVTALERNHMAFERSEREWGLPLSGPEMHHLDELERLEVTVDRIQRTARRYSPSTYAGTYIDPKALVIHVAYTHDPGRAAAQQLRPEARDGTVAFDEVTYSLTELEGMRDEIGAELESLYEQFDVTAVYTDLTTNQVVVQTEGAFAPLRDTLEERHPFDAIRIEAGGAAELTSYASEGNVPPMRAGLMIFRNPNGEMAKCTAGFAAKGADSSNYFQLSAGHCGSSTWFHDKGTPDYTVGPTTRTTWGPGDLALIADVQRIDLPDNHRSARVYEGTAGYRSMTNVQPITAVGGTACVSGWGGWFYFLDGKRCGTVTANDVTFVTDKGNGDIVSYGAQAQLEVRGCGGDSGAPIYGNEGAAKGIMVATFDPGYEGPCGKPSYYSQSRYVQSELNVAIYTD